MLKNCIYVAILFRTLKINLISKKKSNVMEEFKFSKI